MARRAHGWPEMPLNAWPQKCRIAWENAIRKETPFEDGGRAAAFAAPTLRTMRSLFGTLLHWLAARGELKDEDGPADCLTPTKFTAYLTDRRASCTANTVFNNVNMLSMTMSVLEPEQKWTWLRRNPLVPTRDEALASRKPIRPIALGPFFFNLLKRFEALNDLPRSYPIAKQYRNFLIVAVCACTPLRLKNIVDLSLGENIFRHGGGYEIRYYSSSIKNKKQMTLQLPEELMPHMDMYVSAYRPLLLQHYEHPDDSALWLARKPGCISRSSTQLIVARVTKEILGREATPHSFRHSAVTQLLDGNTGGDVTAAALLGHRGLATMRTYYDLSSEAAKSGPWRELIAKYRPKTK
jgi:integrase